jgi:16S rRNA (cytidine1402-2'-O)-methyltransferase
MEGDAPQVPPLVSRSGQASDGGEGSPPAAPSKLAPGLHLVATPIGNLEDISPRALAALRDASLVLCEDTRRTGNLFARYLVTTPRVSCHEHNEFRRIPEVLARLAAGETLALVSDAGTPLISDPGFGLVRAARAAGVLVTTAPGPCAAIAALSISGLQTDRFLFAGFLPAKAQARAQAIANLAAFPVTLVLYESGPRLAASLAALAEGLGNRDAIVARELTKRHEEVRAGALAVLADQYAAVPPPKGEIVLVIAPPITLASGPDMLDEALRRALASMPAGKAAASVSAALGIPRGEVYARALALKAQG